ncbi:MAG: BtrH N-terminal domain-containing protein [Candidatus Lokiarchaeota archaeon]|nr:BtrH N-terminal domain-containing protein [Candidatus Lokiarchaeota archaeon]
MIRIVIDDFKHIAGSNCQLSSLRKILTYNDIELSEPMLLGMSSGLGFFYYYMKRMLFPMVLGLSVKNTEMFERVMTRLGGSIRVTETTSLKIAHENLIHVLEKGQPAITFVDFAYLPFFFAEGTPIPNEGAGHYGAHTFVTYGIDEEKDEVYISDRYAHPHFMKYSELKEARGSKFAPFPAKNKIVELELPKKISDLNRAIPEGIKENINFMYNPPMSNMGLSGFQKWRKMLPTWATDFDDNSLLFGLTSVFIYIETGGTGGAMFRILYRDFLKEAGEMLNNNGLKTAAEKFDEVTRVIRDLECTLLPDGLENLGKMRKLFLKSNEITEKGEKDYQKQLRKINEQMETIMVGALDEIREWKKLIPEIDNYIKDWADLETKAWEMVKSSI